MLMILDDILSFPLAQTLTFLFTLHPQNKLPLLQLHFVSVYHMLLVTATAVPPCFRFCPALVFPCVCHCLVVSRSVVSVLVCLIMSTCVLFGSVYLGSCFGSSLCLVLILVTVSTWSVPVSRINPLLVWPLLRLGPTPLLHVTLLVAK